MSNMRCFEWLRWGMMLCVMAWTASGAAQQSVSRSQPTLPAVSSDAMAGPTTDAVRELTEQCVSCRRRFPECAPIGNEPGRKQWNCAGNSRMSVPQWHPEARR